MFNSVSLIFLLAFIGLVVGTLYSFYWAARSGQLDNLREGSLTIFDEEEHLGVVTDFFPDQKGLPKKDVTLAQSLERKQL